MRFIIPEQLLRLGEDFDITDDHDRPAYHVHGKVVTRRHTIVVSDTSSVEMARVEQLPDELWPAYAIKRPGQEAVEVRKKLFDPVIRFTIDIPDSKNLSVTGNLDEHEYGIMRGEEIVATISRHWVNLTKAYGADIAPREDDALILSSVLAIDLAGEWERHNT